MGLAEAPRRCQDGRLGCLAAHPRRRDASRDAARVSDRRRGPQHHPWRAAARIRERRRGRAVRRRGKGGPAAGGPAGLGQRAAGRHRSRHRRLDLPAPPAGQWCRPSPHPRRRPAAHARGRHVGHLPEEPRPGGHRAGHGRSYRGDPRHGLVPHVRQQRLRGNQPIPLHRPGGQPPIRARLGDEGVHHRGRARRRGDRPVDEGARRQQPARRRCPDPERGPLQGAAAGMGRSRRGTC